MDPVILKRHTIRRDDTRSQGSVAMAAPGKKASPKVRTLVVNGVVRSVEVTCACGETTTIELVAAQAGSAPQTQQGGTE